MQPYPQPYSGFPAPGYYPPPLPPGMPPPPGMPGMPGAPPMYAPPPLPQQRPAPPRVPTSPPPPLRPQDKRALTPETARQAVQRLVISQLKAEGFDSSQASVLDTLCQETEAFIEMLAKRAHDYANLASRPRSNALDMFHACEEIKNLDVSDMRRISKKRKRKMRPTTLITPKDRSPSPELLASDDEDGPAKGSQPGPQTLRWNPPHLPKLPPRHTYLRSAPPPAKTRTTAASALDRKMANAALVQESLRNLIEATEDKEVVGRDGDILGGVVNWEAHVFAGYKKWKVG